MKNTSISPPLKDNNSKSIKSNLKMLKLFHSNSFDCNPKQLSQHCSKPIFEGFNFSFDPFSAYRIELSSYAVGCCVLRENCSEFSFHFLVRNNERVKKVFAFSQSRTFRTIRNEKGAQKFLALTWFFGISRFLLSWILIIFDSCERRELFFLSCAQIAARWTY